MSASPGWRRSADRTNLHANSLVSGNFTGNFAILRLRDTIWYQETAALQPVLEEFPTQINSENILGNSESFPGNREFQLQNSKRPFLARLFPRGSDAICSHRQILKVRTQDARQISNP